MLSDPLSSSQQFIFLLKIPASGVSLLNLCFFCFGTVYYLHLSPLSLHNNTIKNEEGWADTIEIEVEID